MPHVLPDKHPIMTYLVCLPILNYPCKSHCTTLTQTKQPDAPPQPPNLQPHFVPENDVELPRPDSSCHTSDSTSEYSLELATSSPSQEELHTESGSARSSCEPRPRPATALQLVRSASSVVLCCCRAISPPGASHVGQGMSALLAVRSQSGMTFNLQSTTVFYGMCRL